MVRGMLQDLFPIVFVLLSALYFIKMGENKALI